MSGRAAQAGGGAPAPSVFAQTYPAIARWVAAYGWIELGRDDYSRSLIRALDIGGLVWEGETSYPTLDDALRALEAALARWLREQVREAASPDRGHPRRPRVSEP